MTSLYPTRRYWVVSPVYSYVEPVLDDGSGPTYDTRDSVCVVARTKREAIIKGVARMRSRAHSYFDYWDGDTPPWKGFKAELDYCQHDLEIDDEHLCGECESRMEREDALERLATLGPPSTPPMKGD